MSKGRSDMRAERRPTPARVAPVCLASVDLDAPPAHDLVVAPPCRRAWVEVTRRGHVVGVEELEVRQGAIAREELARLHAAFPDPGPRDVDHVGAGELAPASVVVPTICGRPEQLVRSVESLLRLEHPDFEVVVVDNRSRSTETDLPRLPGGDAVRVVREPRRGVSAARNRGFWLAGGEVVAFTDDDVVVDPRWLRYLCARFVVEPGVDALGGLVLPNELATAPQLWFEEFYGGFSQSFSPRTWAGGLAGGDDPLFPYAAGRFGAGCSMAFRRDAMAAVGGFNTALGAGTPARGGEDLAIFIAFLAAGRGVGFEPAAVVHHTHRRSEAAFFRQVRDYGVGLTAMYASLVAEDRRHLVEMARRVPAGLRLLARPRDERSPSSAPSYPRRTIALQLLGMAQGPFAYARSRREAAR